MIDELQRERLVELFLAVAAADGRTTLLAAMPQNLRPSVPLVQYPRDLLAAAIDVCVSDGHRLSAWS